MISDVLKIESIALYGSCARGDTDRISDSDLLIVDSDPKVLSSAEKIFHSLGFSCTAYTWDRLFHMSKHGSLFLQHLKNESIILKDDNSRLDIFLRMFKTRIDYSKDIEATKEIISITGTIINRKPSIGWALDVLAVAVRNLGILELANRGQYVFSLATIYDKLSDVGLLTSSDIQKLMPLRLYKSHYRSQCYNRLPDLAELKLIQRTISKSFGIDFDVNTLTRNKLILNFLTNSERHKDKYCRFRLIEGATIACFDSISDISTNNAQRFFRIVQKQNHYGLFHSDLSIPLRMVAMDVIMDKSANKQVRSNILGLALYGCN